MSVEKTVLVVDDNMVNRRILCKILQSSGYAVAEAGDGQEALDLLKCTNTAIDIILLDLMMPVMDGFELLKIMNETGMITQVPVIVLTGNDQEEMEIRCLEAGASDFLKKPYNAQIVRHRVASILRLWDNAMLVNKLELDRLTGLYNKERFYVHADKMLANMSEQSFMLLYINIEDFKMLNVHYGTEAGDQLLRFIGNILKNHFSERGICGRIGADIFGVLIEEQSLPSQEDIGKMVADHLKDAPVKGVSIKCGICLKKEYMMTVTEMCDYAKIAEESIKHRYGVYYAIYDVAMSKDAMREHQLTNYMEEALEQQQFLVYLQPKHSAETEELIGAEALVRWVHPELGFISPGEFIPLFEKNGFIAKLDYFVWEKVCQTLRRWIDAGIKPVPISVNASRADFLLQDLPELISNLIDEYDIPSELLHVEVTESAYTDNPQQIISVVSTLRDMGFKIEMDDFGSGYSSLNMLSELPIDILKLDMRFMQSGNDKLKGSKRNILSFIVSLSKWLQLPTVAEGVETSDEVEVLKSMGCNYIQGFYFSKPMSIEEFEIYISAHGVPKLKPEATINKMVLSQLDYNGDSKPMILVVEDIESNRQVMKALLSNDYQIVTAENGAVAYAYIKAHYKEIACILLDLLMPVMDGFQLLELLHKDEQYSEIPVVITTETGSNGELRALNLGAHSFVAKPYNPDVLRHHVRKAVEEKAFLKFKHEYTQRTRKLYEKAYHDELTGFLNRYGLEEALKQLPKDKIHAVVTFDIDCLKMTNDTFGHAAGDEEIALVTKTIKKHVRDCDILARIGGDEFVLIICSMSDEKCVLDKMRNLCKTIESIELPKEYIHPSCSAGIAMMTDVSQYDAVYQYADQALYEAKNAGKGICVLWHERKEEI